MTDWTVHHGDCLDVLRTLPDCSVDAVVTDPPYGLSFMGRKWDYDVPSVDVWSECLRVLKPGGHLLAFAGTRTQHRMAVRIEDAGFEIRDMIAWVYGSGFPKSMDVSKAIDKSERGVMVRDKLIHFAKTRGIDGKWLEAHGVASASSFVDWTVGGHVPSNKNWQLVKLALGVTPEEEAAFEREVVGRDTKARSTSGASALPTMGGDTVYQTWDITAPATDAARRWQGWGTALKPALEPITVARKPLDGTVAENVLEWGTGAINVDGCRVGTSDKLGGGAEKAETVCDTNHEGWDRPWKHDNAAREAHAERVRRNVEKAEALGRWPANLIHDGSEEVVEVFPEVGGGKFAQSGYRVGGKSKHSVGINGTKNAPDKYGDTGSAARFFYCPKASKSDRDGGCEELPVRRCSDGRASGLSSGMPEKALAAARNHHPTVKPTDLMRYLCRLVTPPGGVVLDPFAGSGSTGKAAVMEGFGFIGIEREAEYVEIARARIAATQPPILAGVCQ